MIKRVLVFLLAIVMIGGSIILFRTVTLKSRQTHVTVNPSPTLADSALRNLSRAIQFKTVSYSDSALFDSSEFRRFHEFLRATYPLVHRSLTLELLKSYTLLFKWTGSRPELGPVVLMAHQDVVPVEEVTRNLWTVEPFAGTVRDGFIWGRGSCDDKINLISILESVEKLLATGFRPQRTIYLVFGHDEEIGGAGAQEVVALFRQKGIRPELVLDEGGIVTREKVPGLTKTAALLGTSEKGVLTVELRVEKGGGHAAMPDKETAIDILAKAVSRLNENRFEPRFSPSTEGFIEFLGPEMPFMQKMAFANLWLFRPLVHSIYEQSGPGNAMIRTTLVPTIIRGGIKDNVVPTSASAVLNLRLLPGDTAQLITNRITRIIADDRVQVLVKDYHPATAITPYTGFAYQEVDRAVKMTFDTVVTSPFLMIAATDSRHFNDISQGIIKFSPMIDPIGFHGIDERVSLESFRKSLWFFEQLIHGL